MNALAVGRLYNPARRSWPETPLLRLTPGGCELALFFDGPDPGEIRAVRRGPAEFAWVDGGPVGVLCFRFGYLPWSDTPFEPWRAPEAERGAPPGGPGEHLLIVVVLVDAATGIVRALRAITWEPAFAAAVRATVTRQLAAPRDDHAAGRALAGLCQLDSAALAARAVARSGGPL